MRKKLWVYKNDLELAVQDFDNAIYAYDLREDIEEAIEVVERIRGEADAMLDRLRSSD